MKIEVAPILYPEKFLLKLSVNTSPNDEFIIDRYDAYLLGLIEEKDLRSNRTWREIVEEQELELSRNEA